MTQSETAPKARLTLRARIAILTAAAVAAVVVLTMAALFFTLKSQISQQFEDDLVTKARAAVGGTLGDPELIARLPSEAFGDSQWGLLTSTDQLFYPQGGMEPPISEEELAVHNGQASLSIRSVEVDGQKYRVVAVPAGGDATLILSESTDAVDKSLRTLTAMLLLIGVAGVLVAAAAGYLVARAGLRPVGHVAAAAERVARTEDLAPIPVGSSDELGRLAQSFNVMLTSLDAARSRERQLVADAGHELRTPLTSIRTNLDLLAQSEETNVALPDQDRAALLRDVRSQLTELSTLIDDLVQLSKGTATTAIESINFADVVERSVERVMPRGKGLTFDVNVEPWWLLGDATALERAVTNLLDNAVKWSPSNGVITVRLNDGTLTVTDEGSGIPASDRQKVFERFYRASDSRGKPGSGLGLAIVAQAAQQHGGQVSVADAACGGATLTLTLPGSETGPGAAGATGNP